ncbi:MAG: phosphatidate cytidylyltransferase [Candidatus Ozemobacteraceae bacterium]
MLSRLLVTCAGVPCVYGLLVFNDFSRLGLFLVVSFFGVYEFLRMFCPAEKSVPVLEFFLAAFILGSSFLFGERGLLFGFGLSGLILATSVVLHGLRGDGFKRFSLGISSLLYVPFCVGFFLLLTRQQGGLPVFGVLASVWALDIGAYLVGSSVGGPRLAPNISPKKTYSGAFGGLIACSLAMYGLFRFGIFSTTPEKVVGLGLMIGIFSQLSDLFESVLKREAGVKDSGIIFGSHGGMLDRLDSILFIGPIAYFFLGW